MLMGNVNSVSHMPKVDSAGAASCKAPGMKIGRGAVVFQELRACRNQLQDIALATATLELVCMPDVAEWLEQLWAQVVSSCFPPFFSFSLFATSAPQPSLTSFDSLNFDGLT